MQTSSKQKQELSSMFNSLEEAIVVVNNGQEQFHNEKFETLMTEILPQSPRQVEEMIHTKFLTESSTMQEADKDESRIENTYCLSDL